MNEMKASVIRMLYKQIQEYINKNAKEDQVTIKVKPHFVEEEQVVFPLALRANLP
jgi:hypothetical protein